MSETRDSEKTIEIDGHEIELSNLDKVFFPEDGITKGDVVDYYREIADTMIPHLRERAISMHRFPDGIEGDDFYQKDAPDYFPEWIRTRRLEKEGGTVNYVVCDDGATLVYLANQACITPHPWLSRVDRPHHPDRMIFDLDPSNDDLDALHDAARTLRDALDELGLTSFVMTTGSRGFHLWIPLDGEETFDPVRDFAHDLARLLARRQPDRLTVEQRKNKRGDRIFLDYLRNAYGQTGVPPYSIRARPGAPVATPIDWDELGATEPRKYTIRNLFRRSSQKDDPWKSIERHASGLEKARQKLDRWLEEEEAKE